MSPTRKADKQTVLKAVTPKVPSVFRKAKPKSFTRPSTKSVPEKPTELVIKCIVEDEKSSFSVTVSSDNTVGQLKDKIYDTIDTPPSVKAKDLILKFITGGTYKKNLEKVTEKLVVLLDDELKSLNTYFPDVVAKNLIYILVELPQQVNPPDIITTAPEELNRRLNSIEEEFYSEDWSVFIKDYIAGDIKLPVTDGAIPGFPVAWRRVDIAKGTSTHKPSLLFFDLPDSGGSYLSADSNVNARKILDQISSGNYSTFPVFGASGCGKTRTVMDMLSQNWGFYFNGGEDDHGSSDVNALVGIATRKIVVGDPLMSNIVVKSINICLLLARVSLLSRCLSVSNGAMTPSQWMLLQVCPQVLGKVYWSDSKPSRTDLFLALFERLESSLSKYYFISLEKLLQARFDALYKTFSELNQCNPKFLLVLDEAQSLGETLRDKFQTERDDPSTLRPILSPFFHGLEELSEDMSQICIVPCGASSCIYDLGWVGVTGKASKSFQEVLNDPDFTRTGSFFRWDEQAKVKAYFNTLALYLEKHDFPSSASRLKDLVDDQIFEMLYAWFRGRLRPMISVIEEVIQYGSADYWMTSIKQLVSALTDPTFQVSGNLCFELSRILIINARGQGVKANADIREILRQAVKNRLQYGTDCRLESSVPALVEASFGRIIIDNEKEVAIIDEPIAFQAAINFLAADGLNSCGCLAMGYKMPLRLAQRTHFWSITAHAVNFSLP
ncbi:hypothetical protein BGZ46_009011 [Entomortierella lignicola]|nr:hypothetical protein BGZ46_009011 [Entomortierella lignicola]